MDAGVSSRSIHPRQTPEERELERKKSQLVELETELGQRELDLATLQAELRVFESTYLRIVGSRYAELDLTPARWHMADEKDI